MSDTYKVKYTNHKPKGRGNPLGVCKCTQCKHAGKKGRHHLVEKANKQLRKSFKSNKEFVKGIYRG
jgi:hypothetical protein